MKCPTTTTTTPSAAAMLAVMVAAVRCWKNMLKHILQRAGFLKAAAAAIPW
jgi:hypothetical protein